MSVALLIPAFVAGVLTFLAPCTLPLVPAYLGFISGVPMGGSERLSNAGSGRRWKVFHNGVFYVFGFSVVFIAFGMLAGFFGYLLAPYRIFFTRVAGAFVILFGLLMLDIVRVPLFSSAGSLKTFRAFHRGKPLSSFLLGAAFAFGWTPCVGPILASILFLASASATAFEGAVLLFVFSLGLAVPFLLVALGIDVAYRYIGRISPYLGAVTIVGGFFMVFLGALLITDNFSRLIDWGYSLFGFIEYRRLLDYL